MVELKKQGFTSNGLPYNSFGSGKRQVVIFQGLTFENKPQTGMNYFYQFLKRDYTCYSVLRKPGLAQGFTLKDMADDYAVMIRDDIGAPVDVIGISTGGSIAQHFAVDHPELVRKLVIHSSAHTLRPEADALQLELGRLAQAGQWGRLLPALTDYMLPPGIGKALLSPLFRLMGWFMSRGASGRSPDDLVITVHAESQHHFKDRLAEIRLPTLVIAGEKDPFYSPELFRETAAGIPNARLILYPGMGHPAQGGQFARDMLAFLLPE